MQMRFSGNAPPSGWPVTYISILDSDHFAIEFVLAAANQNNGHTCVWQLKQLLYFTLLLQLPPVAALGQSCVQKTA